MQYIGVTSRHIFRCISTEDVTEGVYTQVGEQVAVDAVQGILHGEVCCVRKGNVLEADLAKMGTERRRKQRSV